MILRLTREHLFVIMMSMKRALSVVGVGMLLAVGLLTQASPALAAIQSLTGQAGVMNTGGAVHFTNYESNVSVDTQTGIMSGYAWLDDLGWVAFGTEDNDQGPVTVDLVTGALTGKAKVVNTAGYLDFTNFESNVVIDLDSGVFSGFVWSEDVGWIDFGNPGVTTGAAFDLNAPVIILDSLGSPTSNSSPPVTGLVTDALGTITSVDYQVDSTTGTWLACVADDGVFDNSSEAFTCALSMSLADGSHTIYIRATDNDSNTTLAGAEVTVGVTVDTTPPKKDYAQIDSATGQEFIKTFKQTNLNNMNVVGDAHMPQFCFTRAYDEGVGLSHYTIVVNNQDYLSNIPYVQPPVGDNGDTRQDGESVIKENNTWYLKYHLYNQVSKQQEICAYGKTDAHYLDAGVHSWFVKAVDKAGNSTQTDTNRFLVMTNQGTYQKPSQSVWFPLSLLQVGNRTNLTTYSTTTPELFTVDTKPLLFSDSTPTLYGIAPVGATINLTIYQDSTDEVGNTNRQQVTTLSTTSNSSSEWGVNLETLLTTGTYYLTIQSSDSSDNFAILKDIPIQLSNSTTASLPVNNVDDTEVLGANDQEANWEEVDPSPTTKQANPAPITPTPSPSPQPKWWQFWKWF
jgi:hypothetical protein